MSAWDGWAGQLVGSLAGGAVGAVIGAGAAIWVMSRTLAEQRKLTTDQLEAQRAIAESNAAEQRRFFDEQRREQRESVGRRALEDLMIGMTNIAKDVRLPDLQPTLDRWTPQMLEGCIRIGTEIGSTSDFVRQLVEFVDTGLSTIRRLNERWNASRKLTSLGCSI